jgi:uncharacterized membrane protein
MTDEGKDGLRDLIGDNIQAVSELRESLSNRKGKHAKYLGRLTRRLGTPTTLYTALLLSLAWIFCNELLKLTGHPIFDEPPFFFLQGVIGASALLTTLILLVGQNHQTELSEHRAELDLQLNLLVAQRTAKIVSLLEELRRDLPNVRNRQDKTAEALSQEQDTHAVSQAVREAMDVEESGLVKEHLEEPE